MTKKTRILMFVGNYLPGSKSGGILRSVENSVNFLSDEFDFLIITRNIDIGETRPYNDIQTDEWQHVGKAKVLYLDYKNITLSKICKIVNTVEYDIIHLNSFFEVLSIKVNLAMRFNLIRRVPVILSPRGEFADASFKIRLFKKKLFIILARVLGVYSKIIWHVSSQYEAVDLARMMGAGDAHIKIAMDLPNVSNKIENNFLLKTGGNRLKVIFLSRISQEKNLHIAISILSRVKERVVFHIYGTIEDEIYWDSCNKMIKGVPKNIEIKYCGYVEPNEVLNVFSQYELFLFPSGGENYGHVIAESISVGTKVLISKNTPWLDLEQCALGWDFNLEQESLFVKVIEKMARTSIEFRIKERGNVKKMAHLRFSSSTAEFDNRNLYKKLIKGI